MYSPCSLWASAAAGVADAAATARAWFELCPKVEHVANASSRFPSGSAERSPHSRHVGEAWSAVDPTFLSDLPKHAGDDGPAPHAPAVATASGGVQCFGGPATANGQPVLARISKFWLFLSVAYRSKTSRSGIVL